MSVNRLRERNDIYMKNYRDKLQSKQDENTNKINKELTKDFVLKKDRDWVHTNSNPILVNHYSSKLNIVSNYLDLKSKFLISNLENKDKLLFNTVHVPISSVSGSEDGNQLSANIFDRTSEYFSSIIGWKRNPNNIIKMGYSYIYDIENDENIISKAKESMAKITEKTLSRFNTEGSVNNIDTQIWKEVNQQKINDIAEYFDISQKEIRDEWDEHDTIKVTGVAGTGKTVILNEIFALSPDFTYLITPNNELKMKAKNFIKEINPPKLNYIYTYKELEEKLITDIVKTKIKYLSIFNYFQEQTFKIMSKDGTNNNMNILAPVKLEIINELRRGKINVESSYIDVMNILSKPIMGKSEEQGISRDFVKKMENPSYFKEFFKNEFEVINELYDLLFKENIDGDISINTNKAKNMINVSKGMYIFDEAPILMKRSLLLDGINDFNKLILGYDKYQYPYTTIKQFEEMLPYMKEYKLNKVFRTTKQIFEHATSLYKEKPEYEALIDIPSSISENEQSKKIRLSEIIDNPEEYWGTEYDAITLIVDEKIDGFNINYFYLGCTRAVKVLNIEYKN